MVNVSFPANAQIVSYTLAEILNLDVIDTEVFLRHFKFLENENRLVDLTEDDP